MGKAADASLGRCPGNRAPCEDIFFLAFLLSRPAVADSVLNSAWYLIKKTRAGSRERWEGVRGSGEKVRGSRSACRRAWDHARDVLREVAGGRLDDVLYGAGGRGRLGSEETRDSGPRDAGGNRNSNRPCGAGRVCLWDVLHDSARVA